VHASTGTSNPKNFSNTKFIKLSTLNNHEKKSKTHKKKTLPATTLNTR
jgi:hypothetical protein